MSGSGVDVVAGRQAGAAEVTAARQPGGVRFGAVGPDGVMPGGLLVELPPQPDLSGLSRVDVARALEEWADECGGWAPDPWDAISEDLAAEASEAARMWDDLPVDPEFHGQPGEPFPDLTQRATVGVGGTGLPGAPDAPAISSDVLTSASSDVLTSTLTAAGFPAHVVQQLCALAPVLAAGAAGASPATTARPADDGVVAPELRGGSALESPRATDEQLVAAAEATVVVQRWCDALLTGVLSDLAAATGEEFLARERVASADELSPTGRKRWRAKTKSVLANELKVLTGWGIQDCHDRVGFALGSRQATGLPWAALATGEVQWNQVRAWWSTCRDLPPEVAAEIARRTFGADSDRARSVRDERSRSAEGGQARESFGETKDTLARLVAALLGEDPEQARKDRQEAVARRDASAQIEDDGTGEFTVSGRASSIVAALDRVDQIARSVRAAGDPRTLAQLRADIAMSLLVHGSITPATGHPDPPPPDDVGAGSSDAVSTAGSIAAPDEALTAVLAGRPPVNLDVIVPLEVLVNDRSTGVGLIPGGHYLSAEEVRELAIQAGGELHRLVTDPLDGRLVERSIKSYAFDQKMRDQIVAADQVCRAPGCKVAARGCQFDHVMEYGDGVTGGPTSEINGEPLHGVHHQLKTWVAWKAVMDAYRNVTWTTLFGRVYRTRSFDYRTLTHPWTGAPEQSAHAERPDRSWREVLDGDHDLQDRLVYAALSHRGSGEALAADDDYPDPEYLEFGRGWLHHDAPIQLRHRTRGGKQRRGAPPGQPTPEEVLARADEASRGPDATMTSRDDAPPPF